VKDQVIQQALKALGCPVGVQDRLEAFGMGVTRAVAFMFENFDIRLQPVDEEVPSENVPPDHPGPKQVDGGGSVGREADKGENEPD
jgi:hypothetical protein